MDFALSSETAMETEQDCTYRLSLSAILSHSAAGNSSAMGPLLLVRAAQASLQDKPDVTPLAPCPWFSQVTQTHAVFPKPAGQGLWSPGLPTTICLSSQPTFITASVCSSSQPTKAWPDSWKATTLCSSLERILLFLAVPERSQENSFWAPSGYSFLAWHVCSSAKFSQTPLIFTLNT